MKKNKIIRVLSLFMLGIGLLSFGFVNAAERISAEEADQLLAEAAKPSYVPSLQTLALKYIGKKKIEGNEQLFGKFKKLVEQKNMPFKACEADVTCEVAKIAALEYIKFESISSSYERVLPLDQYKKANPALGFLIDQGRVNYSLSIQDLMDAGAIVKIQRDVSNGCTLDLSNLSLTSLIGLQEVENLLTMQYLFFRNNQLREIAPGVITNLPALKKLNFSLNQLKKLAPGVIANLPALQELCLQNNQLKKLMPGTIVNLPVLQYLYLNNNQLKELIPGAIENLPLLLSLNLNDNQLKELMPRTIENLPLLRVLNLNNNQLKELMPGAIVNLPALTYLNFYNNQLKELALGAIANLPALEGLYLGKNQLKEIIPGALSNLPAMSSLSLCDNQLKALALGVIPNLSVLELLDLANNQLKEFRLEAMENLPVLQSLFLNDNQLEGLSVGIMANLPALRTLFLQNNQLTSEIQRELRGSGIENLHLDNQRELQRTVQMSQNDLLIIATEEVSTLPVEAVIEDREDPIICCQLVRQAAIRAHDACVIS